MEFRPGAGGVSLFEGAALPADLTFDNIFAAYSPGDIKHAGASKVIHYSIRVIDITGQEVLRSGSVTIIGR